MHTFWHVACDASRHEEAMHEALNAANSKTSKCPIFDLKIAGCYHMEPDSRKAFLIVTLCIGNYRKCDVFRNVQALMKRKR